MIQPPASTAPALPARSTAPEPEPAPALPDVAASETASRPEPLSLDVARGAGGVFVYTLRDPATGTVLAVIPREAVQSGRDGRNLDRRV